MTSSIVARYYLAAVRLQRLASALWERHRAGDDEVDVEVVELIERIEEILSEKGERQ